MLAVEHGQLSFNPEQLTFCIFLCFPVLGKKYNLYLHEDRLQNFPFILPNQFGGEPEKYDQRPVGRRALL